MTNVISMLALRSHLGQTLKLIEKEQRSFVVEKRGAPKAIILSIKDYIRLAAPEPAILTAIGRESKRNKTNRLTMKQIDAEIQAARRSQTKKHAAT